MSTKPEALANQTPTVKLLIDGKFVDSKTSEWHDVVNPATQEVLAQVPFATRRGSRRRGRLGQARPSRPGRTRRSARARASC